MTRFSGVPQSREFYYASIKSYDGEEFIAAPQTYRSSRFSWYAKEPGYVFAYEALTYKAAHDVAQRALSECLETVATSLDINSIRIHHVTVTVKETDVTENIQS